jgi:hypothetical protein
MTWPWGRIVVPKDDSAFSGRVKGVCGGVCGRVVLRRKTDCTAMRSSGCRLRVCGSKMGSSEDCAEDFEKNRVSFKIITQERKKQKKNTRINIFRIRKLLY